MVSGRKVTAGATLLEQKRKLDDETITVEPTLSEHHGQDISTQALILFVTRQSQVIETIRTELKEIKEEQRTLKTQNAKLQEELRSLRAQLELYAVSSPSTRSYASVHFREIPPHNRAHDHIQDALRQADTTKEVKIAGVGTTKTGYIIRFKDKQSFTTAEASTEWLENLGNDTKLVRLRFGVVVHRAPTAAFSLPEHKNEAIDRIMEENELAEKSYQVQDIAWLKSKDKSLGYSASLGVWLDTQSAADWIVDNGLIFGRQPRRNDAIDTKNMAIWLGYVENGHDVGTVPANINDRTAHQILLRVVSTVVDRIRWEAKDVKLVVFMTQSQQKQAPTDKMLPPGVINIGDKCETGLTTPLREGKEVRVN